MQLALHVRSFHIHGFNQPVDQNYFEKKNFFWKFQKVDLNLPHTNNYLHSFYIVFTTIYIAFRLY